MSEADPPIHRDAQMLARLAELDLAAAEHVHGRLLAATEADEVGALGRTYQRVARSLRQTLALKAKLEREQAQADRDRAQAAARRLPLPDFDSEEFKIAERVEDLQDALARVAHAACGDDEARREALLDRFDVELDDWTTEDDFTDADLDRQVRGACRLLDLPENLAAAWRTLPRPAFDLDPATDDDEGDEDEDGSHRPWSGSG